MYSKFRLSKFIWASTCLITWAGFSAGPSPVYSKGMDKEVLFKIKNPLLNLVTKQQTISGTVTDETGAPLPGASILIKGTTNGTVTDFDGKFVIEVGADAILQISYLGYSPKEVSVSGQSTILVQLELDDSQLNEFVVVGYGIQKRSDVTGAIASVNSENFNMGVVTNPGELMQGKLPVSPLPQIVVNLEPHRM